MELTTEKAGELLIDVIYNNRQHRDYKRVTDMAEKLMALVTGEDMEPLMKQFKRRESKDEFQQRVLITQNITSTVCQNIKKPARKVPRSNAAQRILAYDDDEEKKKLREIERILKRFWGNVSLEKYLNERWVDLNYTDPNSFIVVEWKDFDNKKEKAKPYPFHVNSKDAIYFKYEDNILQFLITKHYLRDAAGGIIEVQSTDTGKGKEAKQKIRTLEKFTMYCKDFTIVLTELPNDQKIGRTDDMVFKAKDNAVIQIAGRYFKLTLPQPHNLGFVPAARVGFQYDEYTEARTCVSPINEAVPILMKMVKANSELDLTMALHAFPQKIQYYEDCPNPECYKGKIANSEEVCPVCNGEGFDVVSSTQEVIKLRLPRNREDLPPLENFIKYIYPPVDLVEFQDKYIARLTAWCKEAVYNTDIFSRKEIADTATGKNIDLQNVYDALYPFAEAYASTWEFFVMAISKITETDKGLYYNFIFQKDFKMKSLTDLLNDLKIIHDSNADSFAKEAVQDDIARILYTDNELGYLRYKTMNAHFPYKGKTKQEIIAIINNLPVTDEIRILWENFTVIFNEIERKEITSTKKTMFYEMTYEKQWEIINKIVQRIKDKREQNNKMPELNVGESDTEMGQEGQGASEGTPGQAD